MRNTEETMDFRLTYEGVLKVATQKSTRTEHKHEIRKAFHPQLKRLWDSHPMLASKMMDGPGVKREKRVEHLASRFQIQRYRFVPLVTRDLHVICGLDVLFLRPDPPGQLLKSGDIDNRLKTLFDALRTPTEMHELGGHEDPAEDEETFFTLVEDDSLIDRVSVETDMLLQNVDGAFDQNLARLVIHVTLRPYITTWSNIGF